jgi:hypothetical protein
MAITIDGAGTITGVVAGGLPDASVTNDDLATGIASSKLTGALPAISGASLTSLTSGNLSGALPAISGASLTSLTSGNLSGALPAISGASLTNLPAGGITEADTWRLNTQTSISNVTYLLTNWERDTENAGLLGTGMSHSSGIFTFPSTGYWKADFMTGWAKDGSSRHLNSRIDITSNNGSSWDITVEGMTHISQVPISAHKASTFVTAIFDVTNTSTHKIRFRVDATNSCTISATGGYNITYLTFIKLAET